MARSEAEPEPESAWLMHQWIVAGLVSASGRFIPVPFVDDVVRGQCRRFVASRTLASDTTGTQLADLKPYYGNDSGCLTGCLGSLAKAPLKILLFPIRKVIAVLTSVRGVPLEVIKMVLLGRTLQRRLADGPISSHEAARMQLAFDEAFVRMDFRTLKAGMSDAIRSVSGWKASAMDAARGISGNPQANETDIEAGDPVQLGATKLQNVLDEAETTRLFAEFDQRFEESLTRQA